MQPRTLWRLIRIAATSIFCIAAWLLFSASFNVFALLAGLLSSVFVALLTYNIFIEDWEVSRRGFFPRILPILLYPLRLVLAMYVSSFRMLGPLFSGRISPRVVHFRSRLRSDFARVLLCQSITFTPGTITIDLDDDHVLVHWLTATTRHSRLAGDLIKGKMEDAIRGIWE